MNSVSFCTSKLALERSSESKSDPDGAFSPREGNLVGMLLSKAMSQQKLSEKVKDE
jgi:hypothetical protein